MDHQRHAMAFFVPGGPSDGPPGTVLGAEMIGNDGRALPPRLASARRLRSGRCGGLGAKRRRESEGYAPQSPTGGAGGG